MLDIGWSEMLVIVVVALIVIGPRDLPGVLRTVGRWIGKVRSLSREFQRNLNDIARETEFDEVQRTIRETTSLGTGGKPGVVASGAPVVPPGPDAAAAPAPEAKDAEAKPPESAEATTGPASADSPVPPVEPAPRAEG